MVTNLQYFFETARKVRGGRWVWVKDGNGENRNNVLLGGTIANPNKGFGHLWAAQLLQYTPSQPMLIFRSFRVKTAAAASATTIVLEGDGFSDAPEVGQYLMVAPDDADTAGKYGKVTDVAYDETEQKFTVTLSAAIGAVSAGDILVEANAAEDAAAAEPTGNAKVLCPKPNVFNEADRDLLPTEGYGFQNASYSVSGVYNKQAWIERMQPLPKYVLKYNRSLIDGIFWI